MYCRLLSAKLLAVICILLPGSYRAFAATDIVNHIVEDVVVIPTLNQRSHEDDEYKQVYFATNRRINWTVLESIHFGLNVPRLGGDVFLESLGPGIAFGVAEVSYQPSKEPQRKKYSESKAANFYQNYRPVYYKLFPSREEFASAIRSASKDDHVKPMIYVHGFDVSFDEAAKRITEMSRELDSKAIPIFFSWPSAGQMSDGPLGRALQIVPRYGAAANNAKQSRPFLGSFLSHVSSIAPAYRIIAHSMGSDLTGNALLTTYIYDRYGAPQRKPQFPEALLLIAPDIAESDFADQLAPVLTVYRSRVTVYCTDDWALWASRLFNSTTRLGWCKDEPRAFPGIDMVAVRGRMADFLRHSYFLGSSEIFNDIREVLNVQRSRNHNGNRRINLH